MAKSAGSYSLVRIWGSAPWSSLYGLSGNAMALGRCLKLSCLNETLVWIDGPQSHRIMGIGLERLNGEVEHLLPKDFRIHSQVTD